MVLDPNPQSLPVHFIGSRPQPPTSHMNCLTMDLAHSSITNSSHCVIMAHMNYWEEGMPRVWLDSHYPRVRVWLDLFPLSNSSCVPFSHNVTSSCVTRRVRVWRDSSPYQAVHVRHDSFTWSNSTRETWRNPIINNVTCDMTHSHYQRVHAWPNFISLSNSSWRHGPFPL